MTKNKTTKRALLSSAMALFLCFAMLLGTTFAWFTDSVTSANNIIMSGNLDIELDYWNGTEWKTVEGASDILAGDLWEPGYTDVAYLRMRNAGSLALKYQLGVNIVSETEGVNKAGETFKLSDYIYFDVKEGVNGETDAFADRDAAMEIATETTKISAGYAKSGELVADGKYVYVAMVVYMPTSVGNVANHNGVNVPKIDLGVNIMATQMAAELDSFGPDYDEDAFFTDAIVTNEEEFKEALANAKNGAVIGIKGNVTWTTGGSHGSTPFIESTSTYAMRAASSTKSITLLGIGDDATFTAIGSGVGPIGIDGGTVTFKNLKIVDESVSYAEGSWEFGYLEFRGNTVFENCDIVNAIMMEGDSATFKNCSFNSNKGSEYAVWVSDGNATFENCVFTGTRGVKIHEAYGSEVDTVVINNNTFVELSEKPGLAIGTVNADTTVVITNNEFIATKAGDQGLYSYETDTDVTTFKFTYENNNIVADDNTLPDGLYKSEEGVYYATNSNGLKEGVNKLQAGDTLVVYDDVDFGTTQLNVEKAINIDLNGKEFSTTNARPVRLTNGASIKNGTINVTTTIAAVVVQGNEKVGTIENLTINVTTPEGKTTTGIQLYNNKHVDVIKNVTITGVTQGIEVANGSSVGLIENVKVEATKSALQVQQSTIGEIKNSSFYGDQFGVWAQLKGTNDLVLKFTDCEIAGGNYGIYMCDEGATIVPDGIAYLTYDEATTFEGGIMAKEFAFGQSGKLVINGSKVGAFISTADELFAFAKAVNENGNKFSGLTVILMADIDLEDAAWTPIGQTGATQFQGIFDGQGYTIKNLNVDSSAQTGKHYSSGLFGWLNSATVKNVIVDGVTIKGNHNVGVIAGYLETSGCTISNCTVKNATITAKHADDDQCGDKIGVIVGHAGNAGVKVENCTAVDSKIVAGRDAGQIAGAAKEANVIGCTVTNVTVTASGDCTGANVKNAVIGRVLG